jgi:hypothetical protein
MQVVCFHTSTLAVAGIADLLECMRVILRAGCPAGRAAWPAGYYPYLAATVTVLADDGENIIRLYASDITELGIRL